MNDRCSGRRGEEPPPVGPQHRGRPIHFEKVPLVEALSFVVRHNRNNRYRFNWHCHPEIELVLVERGRGVRFVGDSINEFSDGDLCLLGANLPHARHSEPRPGGIHSIVIQFQPDSWGQAFLALPETRGLQRLLQQASRGLRITGLTRQRAAHMIRSIAERKTDSLRSLLGLFQLLALLARSKELAPLASAEFRPDLRRLSGQRLQKVLQAIEAEDKPTQRQMAEFAGMSPQSFCRFFKRQVGKSYVDYVNEWRINRVCRLLLETDQSVTGIAYDAGFGNLSHFNRRFRRSKGMTPSRFRRLACQTQ